MIFMWGGNKSLLCAEEPRLTISAFYCSSEEIPFIGELMPSFLSIMDTDKVKTELNLSNAQIEEIRKIDNSLSAGLKDILMNDEKKIDELMVNGGKIEDHLVAVRKKISDDVRKRMREVLKPHQDARMREIMVQIYGVIFIPKKDLRELLKLEKKQERAIDELRSNIFKEIDKSVPHELIIASSSRCKFVTSIYNKQLFKEAEREVYRILNDEQREIIQNLKGNPFSF